MSKKKHDAPEELQAGLLPNYKNPENLIGEDHIEILTEPERRRRRTPQEKIAIVQETLAP